MHARTFSEKILLALGFREWELEWELELDELEWDLEWVDVESPEL